MFHKAHCSHYCLVICVQTADSRENKQIFQDSTTVQGEPGLALLMINYQLDRTWDHLEDKHLCTSVIQFLDWVS